MILARAPGPACQRAGDCTHLLRAARAVVGREVGKFLRQPARLASALVRPLLWLLVFAAGLHGMSGAAVVPPYDTPVDYKVYMVPGLLGMIALFNGMQSSLSLVYDREMGMMRLLLTAPLHRAWLLAFKLLAGTVLSLLQMLAFVAIAAASGVAFEPLRLLAALPVMLLAAALLAAIGLLLSVYVRQLENFAGAMNFVIFPLFFCSSALYPLRRFEDAGAGVLYTLARINPFTHAVESIRYALCGQWHAPGLLVLGVGTLVCFLLSLRGYDPQNGWIRQRGAA